MGVAAFLSVVACTASTDRNDRREAPVDVDQRIHTEGTIDQICARESVVQCVSLDEGRQAIVYKSARSKSRGLVYWDAGGPTLRPIDGPTFRLSAPDWLKDYDVFTLVEPWFTKQPTEDCLVDAPRVFDNQPRQLQCEWRTMNWSAAELRSAIAEVERRRSRVKGALLTSFGGARSAAALSSVAAQLSWVVLDSPSPPAGSSATSLLRARAESLFLTVRHTCSGNKSDAECPFLTEDPVGSLSERAPAMARDDIVYALFSMTTAVEENEDWIENVFSSQDPLTRVQKLQMKQAAYTFTRRYGQGEVSPDLVGYWAEMCAAYQDWPTAGSADNAVQHALYRMHEPCAWVDRVPQVLDPAAFRDVPMLLVLNTADPVVPHREQRRWADAFPAAQVLEYASTSHGAIPESTSRRVALWIANTQETAK